MKINYDRSSAAPIVMIGCFDTKGEDFAFLRTCLLSHGESVLTINLGTFGSTEHFPVDIEADKVAIASGRTLEELRQQSDRGYAVDVMGRGSAILISKLVKDGKIKAIVGMGGGGGTYMALAAMQSVPLGIPKVCLSTVASKDLSKQVGDKDITLIPSVVDIAGLNSISRRLIRQTAAAVCGMANLPQLEEDKTTTITGRIAISMFGNTTACVKECTKLLEAKGYEVFVFHANGVGGQSMESLIRDDCFDGVLDLTTTELADELCSGICSAGADRLNAAALRGVPQVVAPGCLDMVNFAHVESIPPHYRDRTLYSWAPDVTLMRTNETENMQLGTTITRKLNQSSGSVAILLPLYGLSQIDAPGGVFHQPQTNQALFATIKATANVQVLVLEVEAHINDNQFAQKAVDTLLNMLNHTPASE